VDYEPRTSAIDLEYACFTEAKFLNTYRAGVMRKVQEIRKLTESKDLHDSLQPKPDLGISLTQKSSVEETSPSNKEDSSGKPEEESSSHPSELPTPTSSPEFSDIESPVNEDEQNSVSSAGSTYGSTPVVDELGSPRTPRSPDASREPTSVTSQPILPDLTSRYSRLQNDEDLYNLRHGLIDRDRERERAREGHNFPEKPPIKGSILGISSNLREMITKDVKKEFYKEDMSRIIPKINYFFETMPGEEDR
jgi:hypothetical protein